MADWDWVKTVAQVAAPLITGIAGLFIGTWNAGKQSGKNEAEIKAKIKDDIEREIDSKIEGLKSEMRTAVAEAHSNNEAFIQSVGDTFSALRQKINDVEKDGLIRFLPKDDFTNFVKEYRQNQQRTDDKLDRLLGLKKIP